VNTPAKRGSARHWIVWTLLIALILAAAAELGFRGFWRALSDTRDFAVVYASTRAFEAGANPYDASALQAAWLEANHNQPDNSNSLDLALYPPATYLLLSPLALLDWTHVRWVWLLINLIAVAVLVLALTRYAPGKVSPAKAACATAFILAFGPIHTAIAKGQLTVVVASILALAIVAEARNAVILAAILIGLAASLKPQIAAPVIVLYLVQRRWKPVAVVAGVTSGLLCIGCLRLYWAGVSWVGSLLHNMSLASSPGGVYDPAPTNPLAFQLVNASPLIHRLADNSAAVALLLAAIGMLVCFFLWKRGRNCADLLADPTAFSAACVLGLVLIAHRYYDAAVLVFVFVWALAELSSWRQPPALISIASCLVMAFPLPALLIASGYARAPFAIPQPVWGAVVLQQQSWLLLILLLAVTAALNSVPVPRR
jgi:hypothetical protein